MNNQARISCAAALVVMLAGCGGRPAAEVVSSSELTTFELSNSEVTTAETVATSAPAAAGPAEPSSTPTGARTDIVLPTMGPPTAPPSGPSDLITGVWVLGTVSAASAASGPSAAVPAGDARCYVVHADDGRDLMIYAGSGTEMGVGDRLRVRIVWGEEPALCDDVEAWTLMETKPVG